MKRICLCGYCIEAIRSHGDLVLVGECLDTDIDDDDSELPPRCEWCYEDDPDVYECYI